MQCKPKENMPRYILIKLTKIKYKEKIIKAPNNLQGDSHKDNSQSFNKNSADQKGLLIVLYILKVMKGKNL